MGKLILAFVLAIALPALCRADTEPVARVYKSTAQGELKLYLFQPAGEAKAPRPAMIVLHGGGWHVGEASWTFPTAARYASIGVVAVAVEYRLADQKKLTPIDSLDDVRDSLRWVRAHAQALGIDPARVGAHGSSAGAHLAAVAALAREANAAPDLLVLNSVPADVVNDAWFGRLMLGADSRRWSPLALAGPGAPPTLITMGEKDTVTPYDDAARLCAALSASGSRCEIKGYANLGHLLTRNLDPRAQEEGPFAADPGAVADTRERTDAFLRSLHWID